MSGFAGQAIGLEDQSPTPIGGGAAIDPESKGSMENFIGFGSGATSYDPAPVDFDAADDTITASSDGTTRVSPEYTDNELSWGAGGFSPASLFTGGIEGSWYDPSDFSTMFQDSAGTIPVTGVGQLVGKMLDKSGNGHHLEQSVSASRPMLSISGGYYLHMDGVDDYLFEPVLTPEMDVPWEFWATYRVDAGGGINTSLFACVADATSASNAPNSQGMFQRSDVVQRINTASRIGVGAANTVDLNSAFVVGVPVTSQSLSTTSPDEVVANSNGNTASAVAIYSGTPGTNGFILSSSGATAEVRIFGAVAIDRLLTAQEALDLKAWLDAKAGI